MIYTVTFNPAIDYVVRLDRELQVGDVNRAKLLRQARYCSGIAHVQGISLAGRKIRKRFSAHVDSNGAGALASEKLGGCAANALSCRAHDGDFVS